MKYVKAKVRSQKVLVPFSAAKSGAKSDSKMANKQISDEHEVLPTYLLIFMPIHFSDAQHSSMQA